MTDLPGDDRRPPDLDFQTMLDFAPDAFLVCDRSGRVRYSNLQAEVLFGYTREEMIGQYTHEVECWRGGGERVLFVERLKQQGKVEGFHTQMRRKDGGWRGDLLDSCFALLFLNRASVTRGY